MSAQTILTLSSGRGVDLLNVRAEDIDFRAFAEHLGKEKRYNGATPDCEYSVADHCAIGSDAVLAAGGTEAEAAYFLLHDAHEALWKDDPTPKKRAIAERVEQRCGVTADRFLGVLDEIVEEHNAAIHQAAGLPWPMSEESHKTVKYFDTIMFVTEWRDLMHGMPHPDWKPYAKIPALVRKIVPREWAHARAAWLLRANKLLPNLRGKDSIGPVVDSICNTPEARA